MWALITGGFMFVMAVVFSLGKASSKREDATRGHREELLSRNKDSIAENERVEIHSTEPVEQPKPPKESKTPHPSEQL